MNSVTQWNASFLESKRQVADPLADDLVLAQLNSDGTANWEVVKLFSTMTRNDSPVPEDLPPELKDYFSKVSMPEWVDKAKLELGQKLFDEYGIEIVFLLFCKSLPLAYSCANGAEVLVQTGRLTEKTLQTGEGFEGINRRVMKTAQFLLNVMAPDGFDPDGRGLKTIQKIRLIHSTIRYYLIDNGWDTEKYGIPINQEDLAGTLMTFSYCVLEGMESLGIKVSDGEREAYIHCWDLVGHFIGLDPELRLKDYASAKELMESILARQSRPSASGQLLTKSLLEYMKHMTPFGFAKHLPPLLMREMLGKKVADELAIKQVPVWRQTITRCIFRLFFREIGQLEYSNRWICTLAGRFSRALLQFIVSMNNDFKTVRFYIPPSLKGSWSRPSRSTLN